MRINLHLFAIYAYFLRFCSVWFVECLLQISMIQAKIWGDVWDESKLMKCGPWGSKEACKEAQKTQEKAKPAAQGEAPNDPKNAAHGKQRATTTSGHHGQAVVDTKACGGSHGLTVVSPTTVVEPFPPVVRIFLARRFVFQRFCFVLPLYFWCIWTSSTTQYTSISTSIFIVLD